MSTPAARPTRPTLSLAAPEAPATPPKGLRRGTRRWWTETAADYDLTATELRMLTAAAFAWDRMMEARDALKRDGSYPADRHGQPRAHPALAVERDQRLAFLRTVRELDLEGEPAPDPRMPRRRA